MNRIKQKAKKCPYSECMLPDNNNYYKWQVIYIIVSAVYLAHDYSEFTFISVFLFMAPILFDLFFAKFNLKILKFLKVIFITLDVGIIFISFFGLIGVVEQENKIFHISSTSMIMPNFSVDKKFILFIVLLNILVPVMLYIGSPTKKTEEVNKEIDEIMKG